MKTKVKETRSNLPGAWVVNPKDKGRKPIKGGNIYLNNGEEFAIEIYNPLKKCILADIQLNGESISKTGLMIRPGQREYLDCFIDSKKKFVFKTYSVEATLDSLNAIADNGSLEIFFYEEDSPEMIINHRRMRRETYYYPQPWYVPYPYYQPTIWYSNTGRYDQPTTVTTTTLNDAVLTANNNIGQAFSASGNTGNLMGGAELKSGCFGDSGPSCDIGTSNVFYSEVETGRVEKGEKSKQKFHEVDMDFEESYINHIVYKLLPDSIQPISLNDIHKKKNKEIKYDEKSGDFTIDQETYFTLTDLASKNVDAISLIKKLADLHDAGILTDVEFKSKKEDLLSRI